MDNLTMDILAASRAGMSYGKWKVLHPRTKQKSSSKSIEKVEALIRKKCVVCGREFKTTANFRVVCSEECRHEREREHKRRYQNKWAKQRKEGTHESQKV